MIDFQDIIDMVQKKLQGWKAKLLSQADRTTLISSVLLAMPLYTFSCFRILDIVCSKFAAITSVFWWGHDLGTRKLHLISWDKICQPKCMGELGLKKFTLALWCFSHCMEIDLESETSVENSYFYLEITS